MTHISQTVERLFQMLLCAIVLAMFVLLLWNHYHLITFPVLLDYNEGAMPTITATFISGGSPYSLESQPAQISVYPPLYNLIVAPISLVFGNTLQLHRAVAGFFILVSVGLLFWVVNNTSRSVLNALAAAALFYAGLLYYSTPVASPNSVGLLLFLVSIVVPWYCRFSFGSLVVALLAGLAAFFGKQYFIAGLGYVSFYLFLSVSKRKAIVFGSSCVLGFVASVYAVQLSSGYFVDDVVFAVKRATSLISSNETMWNQLLRFAEIYVGLIVFLGLLLARSVYLRLGRTRTTETSGFPEPAEIGTWFNVRKIDAPLLTRSVDYYWFCFFCSLGVVALVIGKNPGNQMTYLFQLMAPFFLISVFTLVNGKGLPAWSSVPFVLYSLYANYMMLPRDYSTQMNGWSELNSVLAGKASVYASPLALTTLTDNGNKIYNNGHTAYFYYSRFKPDFWPVAHNTTSNSELWGKYVSQIHRYIRERKFEVIVLDPWTRIPELEPENSQMKTGGKLLRQHYKVSRTIRVALAKRPGGGNYKLKVWTPRK